MIPQKVAVNTLVFFLLVAGLLALYRFLPLFNPKTEAPLPVRIGQVTSLSLQGEINVDGQRYTSASLPENLDLYHGSQIQTKKFAQAQIEFYNGDQILLLPEGHFIFELHDKEKLTSPLYIFVDRGQLTAQKVLPQSNSKVFKRGQLASLSTFKATETPSKLRISQNRRSIPKAKITLGVAALEKEDLNERIPFKQQVEKLIQAKRDKIEHCLLNRIKDIGHVQGTLLVGLTIEPSGKVVDVKPLHSQIEDEQMLTCIASVLRRLRAPQFKGEEVYFSYSFTFE